MIKTLMGTSRVDEVILAAGFKKRILIYGSRGIELSDAEIEAVVCQWPFRLSSICIISGGAKGPDRNAIRFAAAHSIDCYELPAKWDEFGKSAGMKRNREMSKIAQFACGWWDGTSAGTAGMTELLTKKKTPLILTIKAVEKMTKEQYDKLPKGI